jgi:hypothetical protein
MAKQVFIALEFNDRTEKIIPSVEKIAPSGVGTRLLRLIAMVTGHIRGRRRQQAVDMYIPRCSPDAESRLELQRFMYW